MRVSATSAAGDSSPILEVRPVDAPLTLLRRLRQEGRLDVKIGCEEGQCGACLVLVEGEPRYAWLTLGSVADSARVETAGTLAQTAEGQRVLEALTKSGAVQCGYCTPGILVALTCRVRAGVACGLDELLEAHHCRCTGYYALLRAAETLFEDFQ